MLRTLFRRLISAIWWVTFGSEFCLDPTASTWNWYDVLGAGYGDAYIPSNTALRALIGGGYWGYGVRDGSRAVNAGHYPWGVNGICGVWCVCDAQ